MFFSHLVFDLITWAWKIWYFSFSSLKNVKNKLKDHIATCCFFNLGKILLCPSFLSFSLLLMMSLWSRCMLLSHVRAVHMMLKAVYLLKYCFYVKDIALHQACCSFILFCFVIRGLNPKYNLADMATKNTHKKKKKEKRKIQRLNKIVLFGCYSIIFNLLFLIIHSFKMGLMIETFYIAISGSSTARPIFEWADHREGICLGPLNAVGSLLFPFCLTLTWFQLLLSELAVLAWYLLW